MLYQLKNHQKKKFKDFLEKKIEVKKKIQVKKFDACKLNFKK